jgi:hypothetical protein
MKSGFISVLAKTMAGVAVVVVAFFGTLWILSLWDSRLQTVQVVRLENNGVALINKAIPPDPAKARPSDGATILRGNFVPRDPTSTIRVIGRVHVSAVHSNVAVVAVFRDGQERPIHLASKRVASNKPEELEFAFELPSGTGPAGLMFQLGPEQAGDIFLNASKGDPQQSSATIVEAKFGGASGPPASTAGSAAGAGLEIVSASYGANCGAPIGNVTQAVQGVCKPNTSSCAYRVDVGILGDPAAGCAKEFSAQFSCPGEAGNKSVKSVRVPPEAGLGSQVQLSCGTR